MVVHFHKGQGQVFTAATCEWVRGLMVADTYTVAITQNVLNAFLAPADRLLVKVAAPCIQSHE